MREVRASMIASPTRESVFLTRIVLENVRSIGISNCRSPAEGSPREWTFLLGENGTGKTTLLRAIALVLGGQRGAARAAGRAGRLGALWRPRRARIHADLTTAEGEPRSGELVIGANDTIRDVYSRNVELLEQLDARFATRRATISRLVTVSRAAPADDEMQTVVSKGGLFRNPRARSVATLFSAHATLTSLENWAMDLDYRRDGGFETVEGAIDTLLPGVTLCAYRPRAPELVFDTADGPMPYRLLSEGYQQRRRLDGRPAVRDHRGLR